MKLRTLVIVLTAFIHHSFAQTSRDICSSQITSWDSKPASYTSVSEAKTMISDIISVIGLKPNFEVMPANIDNAAAVVYMNKRYILYNPDFINRLNTAAGNKWASISILAHEIGHHLNGHTIENIGSEPEKELEADEFSGFVLRRMGATLAEAQAAMKIAGNYKKSLTHPEQSDRLIAIAKGWNTANQQQGGKDLAKVYVPKPIQKDPVYTNNTLYANRSSGGAEEQAGSNQRTLQTRQDDDRSTPERTANSEDVVLTDRNILADINFSADQHSSFYLTSRFNIVRLLDNRLYSVGKMKPTDNSNYPFIITDASGAKLWVDSHGNIVNGNYRSVGYLKVRD